MSSPFTDLLKIITDGVSSVEAAYQKQNLPFPSLNDPFVPGPLDNDSEVEMTIKTVVAAAEQLITTLRTPIETIQFDAAAHYLSATLATVDKTHVANVLKNRAKPVEEIAKEVEIDSNALSRILRYLATRHIFREVSPNVFANNRVSSMLIKGPPLSELRKNPVTQYEGCMGAAWVGHLTHESFKSSPFISEFLLTSTKAASPFNMAYSTESTIFNWYTQPENMMIAHRAGVAMMEGGKRFPPSIYTEAFNWESLEDGCVVVDVGGGAGLVTLALHKTFPKLRYIVQDLERVIGDAKKIWETEAPTAIKNGEVELQVYDFFQPQPIKNASVYFMRFILHDWTQKKAQEIMATVRKAVGLNSKLIVFDMLVPYACATEEATGGPPVPAPLLANAIAGVFTTMIDIHVMNLCNGIERTVQDFVELGELSGWKLDSVKPGPLAAFIFSPV